MNHRTVSIEGLKTKKDLPDPVIRIPRKICSSRLAVTPRSGPNENDGNIDRSFRKLTEVDLPVMLSKLLVMRVLVLTATVGQGAGRLPRGCRGCVRRMRR